MSQREPVARAQCLWLYVEEPLEGMLGMRLEGLRIAASSDSFKYDLSQAPRSGKVPAPGLVRTVAETGLGAGC